MSSSSPFRRPSPFTSSSHADSRRRSATPQTNGTHQTPPSTSHDRSSPSRQLFEEFSRVFISDSQNFKRALDDQADEQERLHRHALAQSLAEHVAVRESAERARERVEIEIQRERRRRREEEHVKLQEAKLRALEEQSEQQARTDEVTRHLEARAKEADARLKAAKKLHEEMLRKDEELKELEKTRRDEEERKERENQANREQEQKEREEKDRRAAAEKEGQTKGQTTGIVKPATSVSTATSDPTTLSDRWKSVIPLPTLESHAITSSADDKEAEHQRYLEMHKRLKDMRKWVLQEAEKHQGMKNQLSEMRRTIKKSLSIFNAVDKTRNTKPTADIRALLNEASQMKQIMLDPTPFIVMLRAPNGNGKPEYPAALLFLLNFLAKYLMQRFTDQVGRDAGAAEPYGVLVATIFAAPHYHFNSCSLIDILWAKYHKVCPVLFGIQGSETTVTGKHRLGWKFEKDIAADGSIKGTFVPTEEHLGNQAGLATSFASITLRNFTKSKNANPAPNRMYWTALARILAVPPAERTATHFVVIRNVLERYVPRFISFYGTAARAVLRKAFRDVPREASNKMDPNVLALDGMPRFLEKDHNLIL